MSKISGSEIVIECLKEQGVDTVFGYPGGTILNVYDALYKHQDEINHVLTSHEQGAAHAADGYARATGKVGVCMATSGPGATNLVTGIATAYMDSIPVVAITANVGVNMLGKDSFQEVDIAGVVMPITKHSFIVKHIDDLAPTIRRAFKIAKSGRPGPVLVDITKDVTAAETEYIPETPEVIERKTDTIREEDVNKVIEMIKVSRRPFIMAGGGCIISDASAELAEFADKVDQEVKGFGEVLSRKEIIQKSLDNFGYILIAEDMDEAIEAANEIAPEHMEIVTANPFEDMMKVKNAGAIFIGEYSSEPLGDYFAGPNHVLPTNGTAKFFSALSVDDFIKKSSIVYYSKAALRDIHKDIVQFATSEQLTAHANSIPVRFEEEEN